MELAHGRYRLLRRIGEGGTGAVYAAADVLLGRTVAIKALHTSFDGALLRREGRALARLSHPGVVALHDLLEEDGRPYLVMEYVDGCDLERWLSTHEPLECEQALALFARIAAIVAAAHERGIVHCDLKPSNVLLATSGEIKLSDFTLARLIGQGDAAAHAGGSDGYAAPEALSGEIVDARTDIFSLGALLRRLLRVVTMSPADDTAVWAAVSRALSRDPADRFATVDQMLDALPFPRDEVTRVAGHSILAEITRILPRSPVPAPGRKRRRWGPVATSCAAITIAGAAIFLRLPASASTARVTLPNLVATQDGSARLVARSLQLRYKATYAYSSAAPAGMVMTQRPAPNTQIDKHGTVTLTISKGPAPLPVPDLNGVTVDAATMQLGRLGFHVVKHSQDTLGAPVGVVISQSPAPNVLQLPGSTVTLTVSQKPWWDVLGW